MLLEIGFNGGVPIDEDLFVENIAGKHNDDIALSLFLDDYLKALKLLKASKDHNFIFEDSVSGKKAGVVVGMLLVGLSTKNPEHLLMEAKHIFLIKDYEDSKLWAALEELDKKPGLSLVLVQMLSKGSKSCISNVSQKYRLVCLDFELCNACWIFWRSGC